MKAFLLFLSITILVFSCRSDNEFDKSKRNDKWVWWIDDKDGKGEWVPINGDAPVVKNGKYTRFYYNGNIYETGKLKNGKNIDTTFFYDENGKQYGYILNGSDTERTYCYKDGEYKLLMSDGNVESIGIVVNHRKGDIWTDYYPNGKIYRSINLVNGIGWGKEFYENGNSQSLRYIDKNKDRNLVVDEWYENGNMKSDGEVVNGKFEGIVKLFYPNGKLKSEGYYKNNLRNGVFKAYYESGKLKGVQTIKNEVLNDTAKEWYENGQLKMIGFFQNGRPEGKVLRYHENSRIWKIANYKNGLPDSIAESFDSSGKLQERENYIAGKRIN